MINALLTVLHNMISSIKPKIYSLTKENLNSRFPDNNSLSSFAIFDPQRLPSEVDLATYGDTELDKLCSEGSREWC